MNNQLMRLRKAAGYKSRDAFAAVLGITPSKLKTWETDVTKITLEDACKVADVFGCSLDDLAGRIAPMDDARRAELNAAYIALSDEGRDTALTVVRGVLASEAARGSAAGVPFAVSAS